MTAPQGASQVDCVRRASALSHAFCYQTVHKHCTSQASTDIDCHLWGFISCQPWFHILHAHYSSFKSCLKDLYSCFAVEETEHREGGSQAQGPMPGKWVWIQIVLPSEFVYSLTNHRTDFSQLTLTDNLLCARPCKTLLYNVIYFILAARVVFSPSGLLCSHL